MVAIRVRPLLPTQLEETTDTLLDQLDTKRISFQGKSTFQFDYVLWKNDSQEDVFKKLKVENMVSSTLEGYSNTIIAYGQTGSGKTYTLNGDEKEPGLISRAASSLFRRVSKYTTFSVRVSYLQIYNEQIRDLLQPESTDLHCRCSSNGGFYVENLSVFDCKNLDDLQGLFKLGNHSRRNSVYALNRESSRAHSMLMIWTKCQISLGARKVRRFGKLTFADLAGSERVKYLKGEGDMIKETGQINKSLFALARVIRQLAERKGYIPYRDSKLTMLLMESLGGDSRSLMVACASPSALYHDQTISTLQYASKMREVQIRPALRLGQNEGMILTLKRQISQLRIENQALRSVIEQDHMAGEGFIVQEYRRKIQQLRNEVSELRSEEANKTKQNLFIYVEGENERLTGHIERLLGVSKAMLHEARHLEERCQLIEEEMECMRISN